jgi:deazaflavin-dependent oxidoreductase (nitroreductase family)
MRGREDAARQAREADLPGTLARTLLDLGLLDRASGRFNEARRYLEEADRLAALHSATLTEKIRPALARLTSAMSVSASKPAAGPLSRYERLALAIACSRLGSWLYINVFTYVDRLLLRVSAGRLSTALGTRLRHHVVLLTTTGIRTGCARTVPLLALFDGDDIVLVASKGGHPRHPAWYLNLQANPRVTVMLGGRGSARIAREIEGAEREAIWQKVVALYPGYAEYQARTARRIPVVVLAPAPPEAKP